MVLYETKVVIKEFAKPPVEFTWPDISERIFGLFEDHGKKTWEMRFGESDKEEKPDPPPEKPQGEAPKKAAEAAKNKEKSRVAPAQLTTEKEDSEEDELEEDEEKEDEGDLGDRGGDVRTGDMAAVREQKSADLKKGKILRDTGRKADQHDDAKDLADTVQDVDHDAGCDKEHAGDDGEDPAVSEEGGNEEDQIESKGGLTDRVIAAADTLAEWMEKNPGCYVIGNSGTIKLYRKISYDESEEIYTKGSAW